MSYGFQVIGSQGSAVIDAQYRNLQFISSGSCSGSSTFAIAVPNQGSVMPQVYVRPWGDGHYVGCHTMGPDNNSVLLRTNKIVRTPAGVYQDQGNIGFDYAIFGVNGITPMDGSSYGLRVWNAAGNIAFDSRYEQPRIQTVMLINQPNVVDWQQTYPQTYSFPGWGLRPWILINPFTNLILGFEDAIECGFMVTTSGVNQLTIRMAEYSTGIAGVYWINDSTSGPVSPFPGRAVDVPLIRRFSD